MVTYMVIYTAAVNTVFAGMLCDPVESRVSVQGLKAGLDRTSKHDLQFELCDCAFDNCNAMDDDGKLMEPSIESSLPWCSGVITLLSGFRLLKNEQPSFKRTIKVRPRPQRSLLALQGVLLISLE
ncbi:hypothetical protein GALMADRAFT_1146620 [Galerina marginata CBS 339.88]|uniref:Uncharacterized protein n=1 Tax=Galerina marginata (strain CBS 339.88) TaxID=685588 RepID=A0A067S9E8_GALM3|nr:hypothetical protein GALMADRAFT_1146620 [Galerina marginata CBS 339.88]